MGDCARHATCPASRLGARGVSEQTQAATFMNQGCPLAHFAESNDSLGQLEWHRA